MEATHLKIGEQIRLYTDKQGFTMSGESILGAIEFHPESDKMKCHECGEWFSFLGSHIVGRHKMTADQYKEKHGLKIGTALVSERIREINIATAKKHKPWEHSPKNMEELRKDGKKRKHKMRCPEILNEADACHKQLLMRLKELGDKLNRTPTSVEMHSAGIHRTALKWRYGSVKKALKLSGFSPRKPGRDTSLGGISGSRPKFSEEELVSMIRTFYYQHGRVPSQSDCRRGKLPSHTMFVRRFGTFGKAVTAANLRPNKRGWKDYWQRKKEAAA